MMDQRVYRELKKYVDIATNEITEFEELHGEKMPKATAGIVDMLRRSIKVAKKAIRAMEKQNLE